LGSFVSATSAAAATTDRKEQQQAKPAALDVAAEGEENYDEDF
jgi:hypothetical protein